MSFLFESTTVKDLRKDFQLEDPYVRADLQNAVAFARAASKAERRVTFNCAYNTYHEITPYSEVYGTHPRNFNFDRYETPISWCFVCPDDGISDSESEGDSEEETEQPTLLTRRTSGFLVSMADKGHGQDDEASTESPSSSASECSDDEDEQAVLGYRQLSLQKKYDKLPDDFCKAPNESLGKHESPDYAPTKLSSGPGLNAPVLLGRTTDPSSGKSQQRSLAVKESHTKETATSRPLDLRSWQHASDHNLKHTESLREAATGDRSDLAGAASNLLDSLASWPKLERSISIDDLFVEIPAGF